MCLQPKYLDLVKQYRYRTMEYGLLSEFIDQLMLLPRSMKSYEYLTRILMYN